MHNYSLIMENVTNPHCNNFSVVSDPSLTFFHNFWVSLNLSHMILNGMGLVKLCNYKRSDKYLKSVSLNVLLQLLSFNFWPQ